MAGKITVACVMDMLDRARPSACGYLRLLLPLTKLVVREAFDVRFVSADAIMRNTADIVIVQRNAIRTVAAADRLLRHCARTGARLVYELDDDLLALDTDHPESAHYERYQPVVVRLAAEADEMWVSTPVLAERMATIAQNVHVLANALDPRVWRARAPERRADDEVRLLFMGTTSHAGDFETTVRPALAKLRAEFGRRVTLTLAGIVSDAADDGLRALAPPQEAAAAYPAFVSWLTRQGDFDIGLAPLADTPFNQAKSRIKWLEYSALGLATVATSTGEYARSIASGVNGLVTAPTPDAFHQGVRALVRGRDRREAMRTRAAADAEEQLQAAAAQEPRLERLKALTRKTVASKVKSLTAMADRIDRRLLSHAFVCGDGIEVGALHNPLSVSTDAKVKYVDRMQKAQLFEHYPELRGLNLVDVDIVDDGEGLVTIAPESQDFIIANHFIEHCEDPIRTLGNFLRVLRPGGCVFMAAPHIFANFDKDRELTSIEHLIRDHRDGPSGSRAHHFREWVTQVEPHFGRVYPPDAANARVRELMDENYSIHFHTFTPDSMAALVRHCADAEGLPVEVVFGAAFKDEMVFILRKTVEVRPDVAGDQALAAAMAG